MRPISYCLNKRLSELYEKVNQLQVLQNLVEKYLPESLKPHCKVGSLNKGCLIITTDNAVWASQLRYILPELRDKLRTEGGIYQLISIKSQIKTNATQCEIVPKKKLKLSLAAQRAIIESAEQCEFLPLKEALERLANYEK